MSSNRNNTSNKYANDLTSLFNNKSVKLISDPEGYSFAHLLNIKNTTDQIATTETPLIVLGDLLDSAIAITATGNILKMGNLAELKSHNLDNLLQCRTNQNIYVMFGNRDLNKLKLLPLTALNPPIDTKTNNNKNTYFKNSSRANYYELALQLRVNIAFQKVTWKISDLKHWYPFWKSAQGTDVNTLWKNGRHSSPPQGMTCLERFFLIFGADNTNGTMSAHNLLYCIPYEILSKTEFVDKFPKFHNKCNSKTDIDLKDYLGLLKTCNEEENEGLLYELELAAALVLIVFTRMIMKPSNEDKYKLKYDGLLYDLYTSPRTFFCAYATTTATTTSNRILAFSHGGITKNLLDSEYTNKYDNFFENDTNYNVMIHSEQGGGYYKKINIGYAKDNIISTIASFNKKYKTLLVNTINEYLPMLNLSNTTNTNSNSKLANLQKPTKTFVKLLAMTSGFHSCLHEKYTDCDRTNTSHKNAVNSLNYSPIVPGIVELRKDNNTLYCSDSEFVQFIGHSPQGFGVTIDLFESTSPEVKFKTYNINLDISNTTFAHDTVADLTKLKDNYLFMVYDTDGKLFTHGKLHVANTDKFKKIPAKTILYDSADDLFGIDLLEVLRTTEHNNIKAFIHGKLSNSDDVLYSTEDNYNYTPYLTRVYGFDNKITREITRAKNAHAPLGSQDPFSKLISTHSTAALYGGKRKTKRNNSKKYKRSQTKKLKQK